MLRTEDTEDEVDLRPRRPELGRRKVPRGVRGAGDNECRLGVAYIRPGGGWLCDPSSSSGRTGGALELAGLGLESIGSVLELLTDF